MASALPLGLYRASVNLSEPTATTFRLTWGAILGISLWLGVTGALAWIGALRSAVSFPPPLMQLVALSGVLSLTLTFSPLGRRLADGLPLQLLIGFQSFRVVVEWMLHRLYLEGIVPEQMTFHGLNYDMLTGLTAIPAAYAAASGRLSNTAALAWNTVGLGFLITVMVIANLSFPSPIRVFTEGPSMSVVSQFPFVWLPTVLVQGALIGHLLIYRKLWRERRA